MRDLEISEKNKLIINDARSGTEIELYYRNPTTQEEVEYQSRLYKRKGKKLIINPRVRIEKGLAILTGFRDGDFGFKGKPISPDPANPDYYEDWKKLIGESAADIISAFAMTIFEGARVDTGMKDLDIETVMEEDDLPL